MTAPLFQRGRLAAVAVFVVVGAIYALSGLAVRGSLLNASPFPHYARLAESFLQGRLDVPEPMFEVATHEGRSYVLEGVGPAIAMLPFVAIWGRGLLRRVIPDRRRRPECRPRLYPVAEDRRLGC